ncbi:endoplasmic reticulum junction formation protein lunapark-A [Takifugu rubripes]|uniref:Endoplasmic reticulum junction formation protein lunapark n=1 Tax=Takifugu rubripes TaxID=31033 RepID=H2V6X4_TAKRU|nr:endoplasmic reticulum junction formation protein lunapark-A [Takifugu rubripes]XP_011607852.1 endoplasmic reticulum junction formation protein lunapark-A [Takifugu rubripes]XP_029702063.1 endoplasmic reticulum junction formation protein lunapark-A [Takifugu rubripes]|eukprot:XP_003961951.1 PREDICTED: protein lunapark [Takifugu rubripes]
MGAAISWWKAKPTTVEILEGIDKDIQILEDYSVKYQRQMKAVVGRLLLYSILLYLMAGVVVYSWYLPEQLMGRLVLGLPFLLFPLLVWILRKVLILFFARRTEKNNFKLEDLKAQKRKILEDVMETETYKNAKLILERFDPESKKKTDFDSTPVGPQMTPKPGQELRHRNVVPQTPPASVNSASGAAARPPLASGPAYPGRSSHSAPGGPPERNLLAIAAQQSLMRKFVTPGTPIPGVGLHPPGPPLARPVLPRERGVLDRLIEYLVGDGPQNRLALVCQQCLSHNGMALKEEFEYVAFRCAYCYFLNPARKTRPQAPRLPETAGEPKLPCDLNSSSCAAEEDKQSDSGTMKDDGSTETDGKEPVTLTAAEASRASEDQTMPESQDLPTEKSEGELDCSAMEVE